MATIFESRPDATADQPLPGTHALIIGVGAYSAAPAASNMASIVSAQRFSSWLTEEYRNPTAPLASVELLVSGEIDGRHSETLGADSAGTKPTYHNLRAAARRWQERADTHPDNLTIFYFAGHGVKSEVADTLLLLDGFAPPQSTNFEPEEIVSLRNIIAGMNGNASSRQVFIIDSTRELVLDVTEGTRLFAMSARQTTRGPSARAIYQAATAGNPAFGTPTEGGFFTAALLEGVATLEPDDRGAVTTDRLWQAIQERLRTYGKEHGIELLPEFEGFGSIDFHYPSAGISASPQSQEPPRVELEAKRVESRRNRTKRKQSAPALGDGAADTNPPPSLTPPPPAPSQRSSPTRAEQGNTDFVTDEAEAERDDLGRSILAIGLARRLHRIWRRRNTRLAGNTKPNDPEAAFVVHLDAPWGGGKTTFANYLSRVLNPLPRGGRPARFLLERYPDADLGSIFLSDPPATAVERVQLLSLPEAARRPWIIVTFNAWEYEHCSPPWWVFFQTIRKQCFRSIRREGMHPWCGNVSRDPLDTARRWVSYAALQFREFGWRLLNPKVTILLSTAVMSLLALLLLYSLDAIGQTGSGDKIGAGFLLTSTVGLLLAGLTGTTAVWGFGALITESIVPGTDTLAERLSLGKGDPFNRFRRHFDRTMHRLRRPVMVIVDDLDRCKPEVVVDLVRGIQTLLRSPRIVFVILGDRDWIERAFENHHDKMSKLDVGPEQSLGARFVEKAIQMSFVLPSMKGDSQATYLRQVLLGTDAIDPSAAPALPNSVASALREVANRESAADPAAALDSGPIVSKAMEALRKIEPERTQGEAEAARSQVEQIVNDALAINAAVDKGVERALVHELQTLAPAFPHNPRQIKRIVNSITMYAAVALQRPGLDPDADLRFQLGIWIIIMTEWPQSWRTIVACPEFVECMASSVPLDALCKLDPAILPGSLKASRAELERMLGDRQLKALIVGDSAAGIAGLSIESVRILREVTPLHTRSKRLVEKSEPTARNEPRTETG